MSMQPLASAPVRPAVAAGSRLHGNRLLAARLAWLAAALFSLAVFVTSFPARSALVMQFAAQNPSAYASLGLSAEGFRLYFLALDVLLMISFSVAAVVMVVSRSDDWVVLFISLSCFMYGCASVFVHTQMRSGQPVTQAQTLLLALATGGTIICVYIFPHGVFIPRWTAALTGLLVLWIILWAWVPAVDPFTRPPVVTELMIGPWYVTGVIATFYRYTRLANRLEQTQIKWVVFGTAVTVACWEVYTVVGLIWPLTQEPARPVALAHISLMTIVVLSELLVPLAFVIAILRYRLWEINVIISRTLVYVPLTAILAGLYSACITLFQKLFVGASEQRSDAAVVLTTLVLVSVFTPVKDSLAKVVDTHFKEPDDPRRRLRAFSDRLLSVLNVLDGEEIARQGLRNALDAFAARGGAVYLQQEGSPRLVQASDGWVGQTILSCPICHAGEDLGLLVLDRRRSGQSYTDEDREALRSYAAVMARAIRMARRVEPAPPI